MHHLPRIFARRRHRKGMDQQKQQSPSWSSSSSPSSRPKLARTNAQKNFEFTPSSSFPFSSSSYSSSSGASTSSAPRVSSANLLNHSSDRSLRIEGNVDKVGSVCRSLGLSGPEDFEIPSAAWEIHRQSLAEGVQENFNDTFDDFPPTITISRLCESDMRDLEKPKWLAGGGGGDGGGARGLKGDRPPLLTPPPLMSLPISDSACSTWDLFRGLAPSDNEDSEFIQSPCYDYRGNADGVILDASPHQSGSSSFMSSHDDDDETSCTTEERTSISPNDRPTVRITNWQKGNCLGQGSFGTVYEAYDSAGMFFAIKEVSLLDPGSRKSILSLEKEIEILSKHEHKNIVKYYGTDKDESNLYIFLELVTKGSLANIYKIYALEDSQVSVYTRQILLGLKYLHDRDIVHRDIKCANILVAADGTVKLADFGLAKASKLNDLKSSQGTPLWMAPEVVNNRKSPGYGTSADIWSLGCTVLEMLSGQLPYHPLDTYQALYRIGRGELPPVPEYLSNDSRDFMLKCLQVNPSARPSAGELLCHPFVKRPLPFNVGSESPITRRGRLR